MFMLQIFLSYSKSCSFVLKLERERDFANVSDRSPFLNVQSSCFIEDLGAFMVLKRSQTLRNDYKHLAGKQ